MLNEDWKEPPPVQYSSLAQEWRPVRAAFNEVTHCAHTQLL
jgi:hypothetical protein